MNSYNTVMSMNKLKIWNKNKIPYTCLYILNDYLSTTSKLEFVVSQLYKPFTFYLILN